MKQKLLVSFSGGRTSAYMAYRLWTEYRTDYEIVFIFANTGCESEKTLEFIERCRREWWLIPMVWVEAVAMETGVSSGHKAVSFITASRNGEPFEEMIQKYGIPNMKYPHCTRELKMNAIRSYARVIGWENCLHAVGIRADEPNRIRQDAEEQRIVYPLAHWFPTMKPEINDWWDDQPFRLELKDYEGNCTWCWKKHTPKLVRIAKSNPEVFDFPARMEMMYGTSGYNEDGTPRTFFRGNRSAVDILGMASIVEPQRGLFDEDVNSGCSESCEAFV